jgi:methyl-accepting chemotaxis protein
MLGFRNWPFRRKLLVPIVVLAAMLVIMAWLGMNATGQLGNLANDVSGRLLPSVNLVLEADRDLYQALVAERALAAGIGDANKQRTDHSENMTQAQERVQKAAALHPDDAGVQSELRQFEQAFASWKQGSIALISGTADAAAIEQNGQQFQRMRDTIDRMGDLIMKAAKVADDEVASTRGSSITLQTILLVIGLVLCALLAIVFPPMVVGPLANLLRRIEDISHGDGDLTQRLDVHSQDELGQVANAFNQFVSKLQQTLQRLIGHANEVGDASGQLSGITKRADSLIGDQHAATEQVATAVHEMSSTVQAIAQTTASAAQAAHSADAEAKDGRAVVGQSVSAIEDLATDVSGAAETIRKLELETANIGKVLDVIQGIAEQTNLLALNAAIEAARAGEQGRGFAVVADEVRTLAARTQQSTHEIQSMIQSLQGGARNAVSIMERGRSKADTSVERAKAAANSLSKITESVLKLTDMNTQIAAAAEQQTAVTDDIARNVESIRGIAGHSSEAARASADTGKRLAGYAESLQKEVSHFRV